MTELVASVECLLILAVSFGPMPRAVLAGRHCLAYQQARLTFPPGAVPSRVNNLSGLPPTFIGVGSIDLFCAEDLDYAMRLALAGVETEMFVVPGAYHGFDILAPDARLTAQFRNVWQSALRRGLGVT